MKRFDAGVVRFTSRKAFNNYGTLGPEGAFVLPKASFDEILMESKGNLRIIEDKLGFDPGYMSSDDLMIVLIKKNDLVNLRIPSGNEIGANKKWIPGGWTSGKIPEAVTDFNKQVPYKEIKLK